MVSHICTNVLCFCRVSVRKFKPAVTLSAILAVRLVGLAAADINGSLTFTINGHPALAAASPAHIVRRVRQELHSGAKKSWKGERELQPLIIFLFSKNFQEFSSSGVVGPDEARYPPASSQIPVCASCMEIPAQPDSEHSGEQPRPRHAGRYVSGMHVYQSNSR